MGSSKEVYEKFVDFCAISLKGENPKFLDLIKSRYEGCNDDFRASNQMVLLLEKTQKNMSDEESRKFVHLKDLLTELKIKASAKKKKKRKHSTDLEAETEQAEKIPKLKDCRVVMDKFPHFNASLIDLNISSVESDDSSKLYPRRSCSIADGNFNSAPCIITANEDNMENLLKDLGLSCHIRLPLSPTWNLDSPSNGKGHSSRKSAIINHSNINDSEAPILHTSHNTDDSKEKLPRMKVELKTPKLESTSKIMSRKTESPNRRTTVIVDVKMSNSADLLIIQPSSFIKRHLEECSNSKDDHIVSSSEGRVDNALVKSFAQTSTEGPCLEIKNLSSVQLGTKSCNLNAVSSTISRESTTPTLSENVPEKLSFHKRLVASQSSEQSCISACVSAIITSLECETTPEQSNHKCLNYDQKSLEKQDVSTLDIRSSVYKLPKRVPLLRCAKTDAYTSSSVFDVKPHSHGSQQKAAQEPKSFKSGAKTSSSSVETRTLEPGASADEFQEDKEHNTGVDKRRQKQVIKLERLLASLRNEIEKCQETEMSLEDLDDENTAYMYEDKLKRKFVAVWKKLCEITERSVSTGRPTEKTIKYSGTRYKEINCRIQKFLNKKKMFPDFHDIKSIVKLTNKKCNLNLSSMMITDVAQEAFVDIGEMLQTRRHQDFIATFGTRQTDILRSTMDPYLADPELRKKVDSNRQVAKLNLDSVIAKYTQLQYDRNCGDEDQEADNDDNDEDDIDKNMQNENEEDKVESQNEGVCQDFEDFVTTASIEVDMAEEGDDSSIDYRTFATGSIPQQSATGYSDSDVNFKQITIFVAPKNGKLTVEKSSSNIPILDHQMLVKPNCGAKDDLVSRVSKKGDEGNSMNSNNLIIIEETSSTSLIEPWQADYFKVSSHCLSTGRNNREISSSQSEETMQKKRGPAIKYTTRRYLPNSGLSQNSLKIDCLEVSDGSNKGSPYIDQKDKMVDISDEDDESSDSTSEKDADDKNVDEDVDEIVMIMKSDSECDTASSSRSPSPISVVSLSSDSLTDDEDNDLSLEKAITAEKVCTEKKQIVSPPNPSSKYWQMMSENDSLEKRLFMHAMGIVESEHDASSSFDLTDGKICTIDQDGSPGLSQEIGKESQLIETEDKTTSSQTHTIFITKNVEVDNQEQLMAEKECIIVEGCLTPKKASSQDDCVIIDTPVKASQLVVVVEKGIIDSGAALPAFDNITGINGGHTDPTETGKDRFYLQSSTEGPSSAEKKGVIKNVDEDDTSRENCTHSVQNDGEMKQRFTEHQKMLKDFTNTRLSTNTETDEVNKSIACFQTAVKDKNSSHSQSRKYGNKALSFKLQVDVLKNEEEALDKSAEKHVRKLCSDDLVMKHVTESNILTSSLQTDVDNPESNPLMSKNCHSNTESSCKKLLDTSKENTTNLNKTTFCISDSDAEINHPITNSAKSSLKPLNDKVENEDVIILDDSSVDQSFSQDSFLPSQKSEFQLITSDTEERILPDFHNVQDSKSNKSFTELTDMFKDIHTIDEDGYNLQHLIKSDDTDATISIMKDLQLGQSESNQLLCESVIENKKHDDTIDSNPQGSRGTSPQFVEQVLKTAGDDLTAESDEENITGKHMSNAFCKQQSQTNGATDITELCFGGRDKNTNERCRAGDMKETSDVEINNFSPRTALNIVEAPRAINGIYIIKQSHENLSQDIIKDSSRICTATNKDNEIIEVDKEDTHQTVSNSLHIGSGESNTENFAPVESKHTNECFSGIDSEQSKAEKCASVESINECFSDIGGFKDNKLLTERQGLQHVGTCPAGSHCDEAVITILEETLSTKDVEKPVCHSPQEDGKSDKSIYTNKSVSVVNAESIKDDLCDRTDAMNATLGSEHSNNSIGSFMLSEKVKLACSNKRNDSDSMLCITNVRSVAKHALSLTDTNMYEQFTDNLENETIRAEQILVDETCAQSLGDNMEDESLEQKIKISKSNTQEIDYEEDGVEQLSIDSQNNKTIVDDCVILSTGCDGRNSKTIVDDCVILSTDCDGTKLSHTGNTSEIDNLDIESVELGHSLDSNLAIEKLGTQIQDSHSASTQNSSLVISDLQSNTGTVTAEREENMEVHIENIVSGTVCSETFVDSSRVEVTGSRDKEDATNTKEGKEITHEMGDLHCKNKVIIRDNSNTCGSQPVIEINTVFGIEEVPINEITEINSDGKQAEMASLDDEDEIKIIEELSSVKGKRISENSKEDDRRLVDQLILDIGINNAVKCPSGSNAILTPACEMSVECWDICENVNNDENEPCSVNKAPEKADDSLNTHSLQYSSVLNVECEDINPVEEIMSPLSVPALLSQTTSPVDDLRVRTKKRKRSHDESFSTKAIKHDSGEENKDISSCVIDVEMLQVPNKQKVVTPDFITDIISTVFSELPLSVKAGRSSTFVTKNKALLKKPAFSLPKSSEQGDVDDEDVVIMEETQSKSSHHPVLHKVKGFKKHPSSSLYPSVTKTESFTSLPVVKKHAILHTYGSRDPKIQNSSPVSSPGRINSSHSLPRLMPRVPIPSIQPNRTSESARTYLNPRSSPISNNSFSNRQQFSCHTNSPVGRSNIVSRPQVSNTSFLRKKSFTSVMASPERSRSGITHSTDRLNSRQQQSSMTTSRNFERHGLTPSPSLQDTPVMRHTMISTGRSKNSPKRNVDGMEIILGDSDDDGEFNNTSFDPKIVSVASLSSSQSNASSSGLSNVPNTRVPGEPLRRRSDVIVIPD